MRRIANHSHRVTVAFLLPVCGLVAALTAGCAHHPKPAEKPVAEKKHEEFFAPEDRVRTVERFAEIQAAEGAREDAMLNPSHFDGPDLNTAGQTKLNLMLRNHPPRQTMLVYMDLPKSDTMAAARRTAVEQYLKTSGMPVSEVELKMGVNPAVFGSAQEGLARLPKTEAKPQTYTQLSGGGQVGSNPVEPATGK